MKIVDRNEDYTTYEVEGIGLVKVMNLPPDSAFYGRKENKESLRRLKSETQKEEVQDNPSADSISGS